MRMNLNAEQARALSVATAPPSGVRPKMVLVEGPPGTGKTTVVAAIARRYVAEHMEQRQNRQVVVLYYTNSAADQCIEALSRQGTTPDQACRVAYRRYQVRPELVDWYVRYDRESDMTLDELQRLRHVKIVVATTNQARKALQQTRRPLLIFDEISQISMADYLASLAYAKDRGRDLHYTVLVGDPNQLPVVTHQAELEINAMAYLQAHAPELSAQELRVQYRMHKNICALVNCMRDALQSYPLLSDESVAHRTLADAYGPPTGVDRETLVDVVAADLPVVVVDTDGLPGAEESVRRSRRYVEEAELAVDVARALRRAYRGLEPVLLSPYNGQIDEMQRFAAGEFDALTVHDMQGREYDAVVLSMGRKNDIGEIGFIGEMLPISYVGFSRAKMKLVLLMSMRTFMKSSFPQEVIDFIRDRAQIVTP